MRCFVLLLLAPSLLAEPSRIAGIRLEGAERVLHLVSADAAELLRLHEAGKAPLADVQAARRRVLDAELAVVDARLLAADATAQLAAKRIELLGSIEVLESRRLAGAQKLAAAGSLAATELSKRTVAYQLAWIEHNHAIQLKASPSHARRLAAERARQRAKVFRNAARAALSRAEALHKAGQASARKVRLAKIELAQAETELAVAQERLRLAEK